MTRPRSRPRTWSSAGPVRRRWPRSPRSGCRWSSSRIRTPPDTSAPTRGRLVEAGAGLLIDDEAFDAAALLDAAAILDDPARHARMAAAARALGRPGRPTRSRARPGRGRAPAAARSHCDRPAFPGAGRMSAAFDPIALGTEIQRRIGVKTSRDEPLARFTTMRVGGPADSLRRGPQRVRAAGAGQVRP